MGEEVEFVELEEELLPALAVGVRRLSDGVHALKLSLEALSRQVEAVRGESAKLAQLLEVNKRLLDEERLRLVEHVEELNRAFSGFIERLDKVVKASLDLGLESLTRRLGEVEGKISELSQEVAASRLEGRDNASLILGEVSGLKGEVRELGARVAELRGLVYELEVRVRRLEERMVAELENVKLLIGESSLASRRGARA